MKEMTVLNKVSIDQQPEMDEKDMEIKRLNAMLAEITAEMNQFSYIVSHDLQAPLRMITGFLELLEKKYSDKLDDSGKQYIGYAVKGAVKMKNLIFDLLEYSRLNALSLEKSEVDLNVVMQEIKEKYISKIEEKNLKLKVDKLPALIANKKQMNQLFEELVDNAIKFSSDAAGEISIEAKRENGFWNFCVSDKGIGIEQEYFEKIFIIFRRLNTDEAKYPGTGVGLTICKKILDLHQGEIWLKSEKDKGSRFYFSLPESKQGFINNYKTKVL